MIVAFLTAHLIEIAAVAEAIVAVLGVGVQLVGGEPDRLSAFELLREVLVVVAVRGEPVVLAASVGKGTNAMVNQVALVDHS